MRIKKIMKARHIVVTQIINISCSLITAVAGLVHELLEDSNSVLFFFFILSVLHNNCLFNMCQQNFKM